MSIADNLITIAGNQQNVFNAGKKSEYNAFWDNHQANGQARNYAYRFYAWSAANYKPKWPIVVQANGTCQNCFGHSGITETLVDITFESGCDVQYFFNNCKSLVKVQKIHCHKTAKLGGIFGGCTALKEVTFDGEIGSGFDLSSSKVISKESLLNIIDHLYDYTAEGGTRTMTFGSTNIDRTELSAADIAKANDKGWTIL